MKYFKYLFIMKTKTNPINDFAGKVSCYADIVNIEAKIGWN